MWFHHPELSKVAIESPKPCYDNRWVNVSTIDNQSIMIRRARSSMSGLTHLIRKQHFHFNHFGLLRTHGQGLKGESTASLEIVDGFTRHYLHHVLNTYSKRTIFVVARLCPKKKKIYIVFIESYKRAPPPFETIMFSSKPGSSGIMRTPMPIGPSCTFRKWPTPCPVPWP